MKDNLFKRTFLLLSLVVPFVFAGCSDDGDPIVVDSGGPDAGVADLGGPDEGMELDVSFDAAEVGTIHTLIREAIDNDCAQSTLDKIKNHKTHPDQIRLAIFLADQAKKLTHWTKGLSFGHPIKAKLKTPELKKFSFNYTLYIPKEYVAGPKKDVALWVDPSHPTSKEKDTVWLPYLYNKVGGQFIFVTVNFINLLYQGLDSATYKKLGSTAVFQHDYFEVLQAAISDVRRKYHINVRKTYISGISAKGASSWFHGIAAADEYAAIHPVSIIPAPFDKQLYLNLVNTPILVWQGKADTTTPFSSVDPQIQKLKGYGLPITYWVSKDGGHGGTKYYNELPKVATWLRNNEKNLLPARVHRGINSLRNTEAYWIKVTDFSTTISENAPIYPTAPPAVIDVVWKDRTVTINEAKGIKAFDIRWMVNMSPTIGKTHPGAKVTVVKGGKTVGVYSPVQDRTVAIEEYCRHSDTTRLWAGRIHVTLP